ncbi:hypothetical protein L218DRAFT_1076421 [Marasmius fiardii PR-910]|nr:hypothetical protein L218DRAFT_1076421 [Marasmius fiardii PR-910]
MASMLPWWTNDLLLFVAVQVVTVPFNNALLRYRVNYQQSNSQVRGMIEEQLLGINSFFRFVRRLKNVEGSAGLFKGFTARAVQSFFFTIALKLALGFHPAAPLYNLLNIYPDLTFQQCLIYFGLVGIISVPMKVFITRSTLTRFRLSQVDPSRSFTILLSPSERNHFLTLYLIPGLFACIALHTLFSFLSLATIHRLMRFWITDGQPKALRSIARWLYVSLFALSRGLLTPFEVVACRLAASTQTDNMAAMEMSDLEFKQPEAVPAFSSENVIQFRENVTTDSYAGFSDCVTKIRREEGLGGLFRGWGGGLVDAVCL